MPVPCNPWFHLSAHGCRKLERQAAVAAAELEAASLREQVDTGTALDVSRGCFEGQRASWQASHSCEAQCLAI